ncbi:MAG: hypothetical protein IJJ38_11610 [Lachnospiraceae bacterium]|nr:hypothetical protein [Lachnospiraceae bacterium]
MKDAVISLILIIAQTALFAAAGCMLVRRLHLSEGASFAARGLSGFVLYHTVSWLILFPARLADLSVRRALILWGTATAALFVYSLLRASDSLRDAAADLFGDVRKSPAAAALSGAVLVYLILYAATHGQNDIDANTYIGEITSILANGHLFGVDVLTGRALSAVRLKRVTDLFAAESAMWCGLSGLHPLIYARIVRGTVNILVLAGSVFECGRLLFERARDRFCFTAASLGFLFYFSNTEYSGARFVLRRSYEGKALLSGGLILTLTVFLFGYMRRQERGYLVLAALTAAAGMSISASSIYVLSAVVFVWFGSYILSGRRFREIPLAFAVILPYLIFILFRLLGVAKISLGG